ncbi:MAG: hypothetical protein HWD92_07195 [Flavobacteriia bacterium]|nr:hypothetical protein [Flavobacteriia bacterium]
MGRLIIAFLFIVGCSMSQDIDSIYCDDGKRNKFSEADNFFGSNDSVALVGVTITDAIFDSFPNVTRIYGQSCRISDDFNFDKLEKLEVLVLGDCVSSHIKIDNPSLSMIRIIGGEHDEITIRQLANGVYLDVTNSRLKVLNGLNPVEKRIEHFYYTCNEDISGLDEVWFKNLKSYSFDPQSLTLLHSSDSLQYYFGYGGTLDYSNIDSQEREITVFRKREYVFRYQIFRGRDFSLPHPTWL